MTIASLPMYDVPELRLITEAWWQGIARALRTRWLPEVPERLTRPRRLAEHWRDPDLLLSQTCGYPLTHDLRGSLQVVLTPRYRAEGCSGSEYRSLVIGRRGGARTLGDARGGRLAVNDWGSHSGMNALRALVAERAGGEPYFAEVVCSGSHARSMALVAEGRVDVAAIDCVTFALLADARPDLVHKLEVIEQTAPAPGLPYVTASHHDTGELRALRAAVLDALASPDLAEVRARLRICGADIRPLSDYRAIRRAQRRAEALGYPALR